MSQGIVEEGSSLDFAGSSHYIPGGPWPDNPDQHWARRTGAFTAAQYVYNPNTKTYTKQGTGAYNAGIGASGMGLFPNTYGAHGTFAPGGSTPAVNGADYGLVSSSTTAADVLDDPLKNQIPYILNGVAAKLDLAEGFDLTKGLTIDGVWFQYGTDLCEGGRPGQNTPVPEPIYYQMAGLAGLSLYGMARRRRRNSPQQPA